MNPQNNLEEIINPYESPQIFDNKTKKISLPLAVLFSLHDYPTAIRKYAADDYPDKDKITKNTARGIIMGTGFYFSTSFLLATLHNIIYDSAKVHYALFPPLIPITTNFLSGAYELLRDKK